MLPAGLSYKMNPEEKIKFPLEAGKYSENCGWSLELHVTLEY